MSKPAPKEIICFDWSGLAKNSSIVLWIRWTLVQYPRLINGRRRVDSFVNFDTKGSDKYPI